MSVSEKKNTGPVLLWGTVVALLLVVADQLTKIWALGALTEGERIPLVGDFLGLQLLFNPGAAFSLGESSTIIFTVVACVVVVAIPILLRTTTSRGWALALSGVWGGAAGNLGDRLFRAPGVGRGHVVDFIAYSDWFIGNVADIILFVSIAIIAILAFMNIPRAAADQADVASDEAGAAEVSTDV